MNHRFALRFTLLILLHSAPLIAQDRDAAARRYSLEFSISPHGRMESSSLRSGSYPLRLHRGLTIRTDDFGFSTHSGSPAVEIGMSLDGERTWVFAGMELHPSLHDDDGTQLSLGRDSTAAISSKTLRGYSIYAGVLAEARILGFFGVYGKLSAGWFRFDQSVFVSERAGALSSGTTYHPDVSGVGGSLGIGIYFDLWGTRLRIGYRGLYTGSGNGTVTSEDLRLALAFRL